MDMMGHPMVTIPIAGLDGVAFFHEGDDQEEADDDDEKVAKGTSSRATPARVHFVIKGDAGTEPPEGEKTGDSSSSMPLSSHRAPPKAIDEQPQDAKHDNGHRVFIEDETDPVETQNMAVATAATAAQPEEAKQTQPGDVEQPAAAANGHTVLDWWDAFVDEAVPASPKLQKVCSDVRVGYLTQTAKIARQEPLLGLVQGRCRQYVAKLLATGDQVAVKVSDSLPLMEAEVARGRALGATVTTEVFAWGKMGSFQVQPGKDERPFKMRLYYTISEYPFQTLDDVLRGNGVIEIRSAVEVQQALGAAISALDGAGLAHASLTARSLGRFQREWKLCDIHHMVPTGTTLLPFTAGGAHGKYPKRKHDDDDDEGDDDDAPAATPPLLQHKDHHEPLPLSHMDTLAGLRQILGHIAGCDNLLQPRKSAEAPHN